MQVRNVAQVLFEMHVLHVDESALLPAAWRTAAEQHTGRLRHLVQATYAPDSFTVCKIQDVYGVEAPDDSRLAQLHSFLSAITDATRRQDASRMLQRRLLLSMAAAQGCNKLLVGDCATHLVRHFIAAAAKVLCFSVRCFVHHLRVAEQPKKSPDLGIQ